MFYDKFMCADGTEMKMENKYFHISGAFSSLRHSWWNSLEHTLKWIEAHLQPISWLNFFFLPLVLPPSSFRLLTKLSAAATQPQTYDTHTRAHDLLSNIIIIKSLILENSTWNNKKRAIWRRDRRSAYTTHTIWIISQSAGGFSGTKELTNVLNFARIRLSRNTWARVLWSVEGRTWLASCWWLFFKHNFSNTIEMAHPKSLRMDDVPSRQAVKRG